MTLEFDKILQSLYSKGQHDGARRLESKRREINGLIEEILVRNDDKQTGQLRKSMDGLKKRVNEVLKVFKGELDAKYARKMQAMEAQSRDVSDITSARHPLS